MLIYEQRYIWGFGYHINGLSGYATLFTHTSGGDNNVLHKYIDIEHDIAGGGYYDRLEAKRSFENKIKELTEQEA